MRRNLNIRVAKVASGLFATLFVSLHSAFVTDGVFAADGLYKCDGTYQNVSCQKGQAQERIKGGKLSHMKIVKQEKGELTAARGRLSTPETGSRIESEERLLPKETLPPKPLSKKEREVPAVEQSIDSLAAQAKKLRRLTETTSSHGVDALDVASINRLMTISDKLCTQRKVLLDIQARGKCERVQEDLRAAKQSLGGNED